MPDQLRDLAEELAELLPEKLPAHAVRVERARGLAATVLGRPARLTALEVRDGCLVLRLEELPGAAARRDDAEPPLVPWVLRVVHGVTISRRQVALRRWLAQLERTLQSLSAETNRAEAAARRLFTALGAGRASAGLDVEDDEIDEGLATLAGRLHDRVPPDVQASVGRIADVLRRALATADDERQHWLIRRMATDYLPTTLRVYLELPADWADPQRLADGRAPLDLLRDQLADLEHGAREVYQATLEDDAGRLLANGTFLRDRFAPRDTPLTLDGTRAGGAGTDGAGAGGSGRVSGATPAATPALATRAQVTALFGQLDTDADGRLSRAELAALLADVGEPLRDESLGLLLASADADGDDQLTLDELVTYLVPGVP